MMIVGFVYHNYDLYYLIIYHYEQMVKALAHHVHLVVLDDGGGGGVGQNDVLQKYALFGLKKFVHDSFDDFDVKKFDVRGDLN
jgi:hypothetical protein